MQPGAIVFVDRSKIKINLRILGKHYSVIADPDDKVSSLREIIFTKSGLRNDNGYTLKHGRKVLDEKLTIF
jgi:hypothetical protein